MKIRTGKECKKTNCVNYKYHSNWYSNLGTTALTECMECKNAHVSQYRRKVDNEVQRLQIL